MAEMSSSHKIAVAVLFATIFVARSPSSAIAVINEMRANGPFTKTVIPEIDFNNGSLVAIPPAEVSGRLEHTGKEEK